MDEKHFDQFTQSLVGIGSRRRLLRLVGMLPLGVLLSARIGGGEVAEEVAAASLGGRHGNNHRGRDNNRKHRKHDKHNKRKGGKAPGLGGGAPQHFDVQFVIENKTSADINFEGLSFHEEQIGKVCRTKALQTIHPTEAITFHPDDTNADPSPTILALLNNRYGFTVAQEYNDDFPRVWAEYGWNDENNINDCPQDGKNAILNRRIGVGQTIPVTMEGHKFEIVRENDLDGARLIRIRALS